MKANELKVTDLMVGDWVMSFGAPHKVVGIRTDMFEPHIRTDVSDTWYEEGIENLLEPISLTTEILEKNGFGGNKPKVKLILEDTRELLYHIYEKTLTVYWNCKIVFRSPCAYVHQLQHALRLCGVNKEIEL
jgi:hypothetical protein